MENSMQSKFWNAFISYQTRSVSRKTIKLNWIFVCMFFLSIEWKYCMSHTTINLHIFIVHRPFRRNAHRKSANTKRNKLLYGCQPSSSSVQSLCTFRFIRPNGKLWVSWVIAGRRFTLSCFFFFHVRSLSWNEANVIKCAHIHL